MTVVGMLGKCSKFGQPANANTPLDLNTELRIGAGLLIA